MLQLQHISKTYYVGDEAVHALADVSLHVRPHEFVAICGPSGSGKTTLMNVMGCLDLPDAGTYILDGVNIADCNDRELSRIRSEKIGFVFQQFNLLDQMSALENVELPMIYQKVGERERRERAQDALTLVGLGKRMQHRPSQLSGGQQQRVAIARALAAKPAILLADEPTGNLDSRTSQDVMGLLKTTSTKFSQTIVMITHNEEIAQLADRIIHIEDGRIVTGKAGEAL